MVSDLRTYPNEEKQTSCYSEEILIRNRGRQRMGTGGKSRCIMIHWLCLILSRRKTLLSNIGNVTPFGKRMDNRRGWRIWIIGFFPLRILVPSLIVLFSWEKVGGWLGMCPILYVVWDQRMTSSSTSWNCYLTSTNLLVLVQSKNFTFWKLF